MLRWWLRRRIEPPRADPVLARTRLGAMREDAGRFAGLSGARILIYWPHGFGDWVHLGAIVPLLEPSNTYAVTRFGDDYVSVMEGNRVDRCRSRAACARPATAPRRARPTWA